MGNGETLSPHTRLGVRLGIRLGERLGERLGVKSGEMLFERLGKIKNIHLHLPSPDEGFV